MRRDRPRAGTRGQLSLSVVEAVIGVLLVLTVAATFGVGLPDAGTHAADLDAHAADVATALTNEPGADGGANDSTTPSAPIGEALGSAATFEAEREAIARRSERLAPSGTWVVVRTPHGSVGIEPPREATVGRATAMTRHGRITVEVWSG